MSLNGALLGGQERRFGISGASSGNEQSRWTTHGAALVRVSALPRDFIDESEAVDSPGDVREPHFRIDWAPQPPRHDL